MTAGAAVVEPIARPICVRHHVRVVWAAGFDASRKCEISAHQIENGRDGFVFDEPTTIFVLLQVFLDF